MYISIYTGLHTWALHAYVSNMLWTQGNVRCTDPSYICQNTYMHKYLDAGEHDPLASLAKRNDTPRLCAWDLRLRPRLRHIASQVHVPEWYMLWP